ncbi:MULTISPECIES: AIM24 family protein [unclassified Butyrivibrio]|uniref:AIM24 family protein n=1 Tax=unclassified Butyrivibrio TaxID=2639466 RepID=UPI0003FF08BD|nr:MULTISPECIES: AIM24 family protein [unclassified Butyrivibrio]
MNIRNFENEGRKFVNNMGNFHVLEYLQDASVSPMNASTEYFMSKMGVHRRQLVIQLDENNSAIVQAGAMQWSAGNIEATSGIKGVGDLFGKMVKGAVTKESAVKPEYVGNGFLTLEPTYKFIILVDVGSWGSGITIEDGMFYACSGTVKNTVVSRKNLSSAALGGEGLFNLSLSGSGIAALESNVPYNELVEVELENDTLKIDGNLAVCWSSNLDFTVERSTKTLLGSAVSGEGLVNVYRGTGKVLMSPVAPTSSLYASTNTIAAKAAAITSNTLGH